MTPFELEIVRCLPDAKAAWRRGQLLYRGANAHKNIGAPEKGIFVQGEEYCLGDDEYDVRAGMQFLAQERGLALEGRPWLCDYCDKFHSISAVDPPFRAFYSRSINSLAREGWLLAVKLSWVKKDPREKNRIVRFSAKLVRLLDRLEEADEKAVLKETRPKVEPKPRKTKPAKPAPKPKPAPERTQQGYYVEIITWQGPDADPRVDHEVADTLVDAKKLAQRTVMVRKNTEIKIYPYFGEQTIEGTGVTVPIIGEQIDWNPNARKAKAKPAPKPAEPKPIVEKPAEDAKDDGIYITASKQGRPIALFGIEMGHMPASCSVDDPAATTFYVRAIRDNKQVPMSYKRCESKDEAKEHAKELRRTIDTSLPIFLDKGKFLSKL
jgi:hypothetical protein